ncbi:hypothetical protein EW146_g707 [Bondarzewia mesenterica]|uniref:Uncharacterized protein n=1 Tax=Bondarzewia mesenterica TaxID=1095465 RepID=A0A4S4MC94_9AGAM|nr:hypothetical protein EW146_g707 [Bondarzewia mesenterica]
MKFNFLLLVCSSAVSAMTLLDHNLVYRSPFHDRPQFSRDTREIHERHVRNARRQVISASTFKDEHYPTFYGADFSNSPFIWSGGLNFTHSVASGDPFDTSVLLWTRAVPMANGSAAQPDQSVPVCVSWEIFNSPSLSGRPVDSGEAFTSYDVDFTVKVEATGLKADTKYWYFFADCTNPSSISPTGATRTLPSPDTPAYQVSSTQYMPSRLAALMKYGSTKMRCDLGRPGYFNAYGFAAHNTSADVFIHLGDYDDHEVADNSWKAGTADSNDTATGCSFSPSGACFTDRKLAAVRAYHEWMPIRQVATDDKLRIWRNFQIGKLLDLAMLDTRQYDRDLTDVYYNTECEYDVNTIAAFPNRSLMGFPQEKWFFDSLSESKSRGAIWRVVGQQIVFTQLNESGSCKLSPFDARLKLYFDPRGSAQQTIWTPGMVIAQTDNESSIIYISIKLTTPSSFQETVTLTGHLISPIQMILGRLSLTRMASLPPTAEAPADSMGTRYDPTTGQGAIGVEFAGTAVTSGSSFGTNIQPAAANAISEVYVAVNEELQWSEGSYRGFFTLTINPSTLTATYYAMNNISQPHLFASVPYGRLLVWLPGFPNLDGFASAQFVVKNGANKLTRPVAGGMVEAGVLKSNVSGNGNIGNGTN